MATKKKTTTKKTVNRSTAKKTTSKAAAKKSNSHPHSSEDLYDQLMSSPVAMAITGLALGICIGYSIWAIA